VADTVDVDVIYSDPRRYVAKLTSISDGTGESAVAKVDISTLTLKDGSAAKKVVVEEIFWNIQGMTSVRLFFDHTTDDLIAPISGSGYLDLTAFGGFKDPASAGDTGDILLTTNGAASGGTYLIILVIRLEP
jgi:hypothetical protein